MDKKTKKLIYSIKGNHNISAENFIRILEEVEDEYIKTSKRDIASFTRRPNTQEKNNEK